MKTVVVASMLACAFLITGCAPKEAPHNLVDDFKSIQDNASEINSEVDEAPTHYAPAPMFPDERLEWPDEIKTKLSKRFSIALNPKIHLHELLLDLAHQCGVTLAIETDIKQSLHYTAQNETFIEILKSICSLAKLTYRLDNSTLVLSNDSPYFKDYHIPYLSSLRQSSHEITTASDVFSVQDGAQKAADNGSKSHLKVESKNDFWAELEQNLTNILRSVDTHNPSTFSIHKQAGIIGIYATDGQHKIIRQYLSKIHEVMSSQVLIEAKIIEVNLNDDYRGGIHWDTLRGVWEAKGHFIKTPDAANTTQILALGQKRGTNFEALAHYMEHFGRVKTLSSPRLTVMNNQSAVLKVAQNEIYFQIQYTERLGNDRMANDLLTTSSKVQSIPIGLVMIVHPSINPKTREVILTLRPTITSIKGFRDDPGVSLKNATVRSQVPIVDIREIDSVLTMRSGEVAIMGGLMIEKVHDDLTGIPHARNIPLLGKLLQGQEREKHVVELVMLLRVKVLNGQNQKNMSKHLKNRFNTTFNTAPIIKEANHNE